VQFICQIPSLISLYAKCFTLIFSVYTHCILTSVQVTKHSGDAVVELTPIQMFACNVYHLLFESGGRLPLSAFESAYLRMFGTPCQPAQFGQFSTISLLQSIPGTVLLRGRSNKKRLVLNKDLACEYLFICMRCVISTECKLVYYPLNFASMMTAMRNGYA